MDKLITNLLWTGGWDSTFRLLQSLIIQRNTVQPHYILDVHRHSLRNELLAMHLIKTEVFKKFPFTRELLLPTILTIKTEINISDETKRAFKDLPEIPGTQYLWISSYCEISGISNLELGIEKDLEGQRFNFIIKHLKKISREGQTVFILDEKYKETPFYRLFHHYVFPLADISREEMLEIAIKYEFVSIMNLTWFCHTPLSNGEPCGVCIPCTQLFHGFSKNRLPKRAKFRYFFRYFLNPVLMNEDYPGIYNKLKKIKHFGASN
jgi:hypothetical protein